MFWESSDEVVLTAHPTRNSAHPLSRHVRATVSMLAVALSGFWAGSTRAQHL